MALRINITALNHARSIQTDDFNCPFLTCDSNWCNSRRNSLLHYIRLGSGGGAVWCWQNIFSYFQETNKQINKSTNKDDTRGWKGKSGALALSSRFYSSSRSLRRIILWGNRDRAWCSQKCVTLFPAYCAVQRYPLFTISVSTVSFIKSLRTSPCVQRTTYTWCKNRKNVRCHLPVELFCPALPSCLMPQSSPSREKVEEEFPRSLPFLLRLIFLLWNIWFLFLFWGKTISTGVWVPFHSIPFMLMQTVQRDSNHRTSPPSSFSFLSPMWTTLRKNRGLFLLLFLFFCPCKRC